MTAQLLLNSFLLGLSIAAPIGPVNLAAIRTGLVRGVAAGWLVGMGAAVVDTTYLLLTYAGVGTFVLRLPWLTRLIAVAGACLLARLAWTAFREAFAAARREGRDAGRTGLGAFWWGMGITAANPVTIAYWLSVGSAFGAAHLAGLAPVATAAALLTVGMGTAAWFSLLALLMAVARPWVVGRGAFLRGVNAVSGACLAWFAASLLLKVFAW